MSDQPQPLFAPLERLGAEVERMALAAEQHAPRRRRVRRAYARRPGLVIALVLLLLLAAAAAIAASGLLSGDPVRNPVGFPYRSDRGVGTVVPGTVRLTSLRVADPVGGPPWGIRTLRTTRGLGCVQVGRVVDGRLGVLGQDGVFDNDGKFHVLPPDVLLGTQCAALDAARHLFIAISGSGIAGSGLFSGCTAQRTASPAGAPPPCPRADLRNISFGTLGPRGVSVDYAVRPSRRIATQRAVGPDRAYLVVTGVNPRHPGAGGWFSNLTPGPGFKAVHYDDGSTCRVVPGRAAGGARPCPAKGYAMTTYAAAALRAPVTATLGAIEIPPTAPGLPRARYHMRAVRISFRAPVATPDARQFYTVTVQPRGPHPFGHCGFGFATGPIDRTLAAGQLATFTMWAKPRCRLPLDVVVRLHRQSPDDPDAMPYAGSRSGKGDPLVGRATARP